MYKYVYIPCLLYKFGMKAKVYDTRPLWHSIPPLTSVSVSAGDTAGGALLRECVLDSDVKFLK